MAELPVNPDSSQRIENALPKSSSLPSSLARPLKTPGPHQGMTPQEFFDAIGTISPEVLDEIEKAIEEGCGKVTAHDC